MKAKRAVLGLAVAAGLAACGGGLLAVLQIVTPLGGNWNSAGTSILFTELDPATQVFLTKFDVKAEVNSNDGVCGSFGNALVEVVGTVDNGALVLRSRVDGTVCIQGTFSDLRKLDTVALGNVAARSYENDQVEVQLQIGLWVSESGTLRLKFNNPSTVFNLEAGNAVDIQGCDVSNPNAVVGFTGQLQGFDKALSRRPVIPLVQSNGQTLFTQVEFVDGATLRLLTATGQLVTLKRQSSSITCPP